LVTNLPAEAKAKWLKYMEARTTEEKIKALEEFLSAVPKHKGTENLVYWAKRRLAELKEEARLLRQVMDRRSESGGGQSGLSLGEKGKAEIAQALAMVGAEGERAQPFPFRLIPRPFLPERASGEKEPQNRLNALPLFLAGRFWCRGRHPAPPVFMHPDFLP